MLYPIDIINKKLNKQKISMLTCYDYSMATILDKTDVDIILVGDSLGNVMLGYKDTIPVTVEDIIHHTASVVRGAPSKFIIADLPFMSANCGLADSLKSVQRIIQQTGAHGVKLEGGDFNAELIEKLSEAGVPVMGHLGLTPQSYISLGGYKKQGKTDESRKRILHDALVLENAGAFAIVLECMMPDLTKEVAQQLKIPTIGIGSGNDADGQVLVINDLIGLTESKMPSFVTPKLNLAEQIKGAVKLYIEEVKK